MAVGQTLTSFICTVWQLEVNYYVQGQILSFHQCCKNTSLVLQAFKCTVKCGLETFSLEWVNPGEVQVVAIRKHTTFPYDVLRLAGIWKTFSVVGQLFIQWVCVCLCVCQQWSAGLSVRGCEHGFIIIHTRCQVCDPARLAGNGRL